MTHPPSGPSNPTPPPGPGLEPRPLSLWQRVDNYRRQNGSRPLTPRQKRRIKHKANKNT